jgi:hypothetical protein
MLEKFTCNKCSGKIINTTYTFDVYQYCENCYHFYGGLNGFYMNAETCCNYSNQIIVKHPIKGGTFQLKKQCLNCGRISSNSIKKGDLDISSVPFEDKQLELEKRDLIIIESNYVRNSINYQRDEKFETIENLIELYYNGYKKYLLTKEWKLKRNLVFKRDNNLCQSCFTEIATEVHHLTYKHIFNEPLFDLIAVCRKCHESITKMDKNEINPQKIHIV